MLQFATEFPIKPIPNKPAFVAQVVTWLRGTNYSTVLDCGTDEDLDSNSATIRAESGEELRIRALESDISLQAIGFRHDFPDGQGRRWRTEAVVRSRAADDAQDLIRFRTQCLAQESNATLKNPKKPFIIKTLLNDTWGGSDLDLEISDKAHWLEDTDEGISVARSVTLGDASRWLPIIYVSADDAGRWLLSQAEINKLAYDLGGIAHILVEPSRSFSFKLRDKTAGKNVYGGTIGLYVPKHGVLRRFYLGWQFQDKKDLLKSVREAALNIRSQMPAYGWDWTELQEQVLRIQRQQERNKLNSLEIEELYQGEINALQERLEQTEQALADRPYFDTSNHDQDYSLEEDLIHRLGPEMYRGEIIDRLRLSALITLSYSDQQGLDPRSCYILRRFSDDFGVSAELSEFSAELKRATENSRNFPRNLISLLERHGYKVKSEKKHIVLEARNGYDGLDFITVPKTPSDNRALKNLRSQIKEALGIGKLAG